MDGEDDEIGWDGPNIRPPPVKQDSFGSSSGKNRSRFGGADRRHRNDHHRPSSQHSQQSRHRDSGNRSRDHPRDHRDRRGGHVEDLRGRLSSQPAKSGSGSEHSHRRHGGSSSREKDRQVRVQQDNRGAEAHRSRKPDPAPSRSSKDVDVRRPRQEVQRQSRTEEERVNRKRDHSRSRTDGNRKQKKTEEAVVEIQAKSDPEEKEESEEEEEGSEESGSSDSSSESGDEEEGGSESGEVESSSNEESSDDDTASEQAENTPEHEDEQDEEAEEAEAAAATEVEPSKSDGKWKSSERSSRRSTYSDGQSRTPSRSPTPRRRSDDEDTMEARAMTSNKQQSQEGTPVHDDDDDYQDEEELEAEKEPEVELPPYLPSVYGCRNLEEFELLNKVEEGTYGVVYRAIERKTREVVALKRLKMEKEKDGFPITSLREINTLLISQHPNVVTVREIVVGSDMDRIYIVMDFVEHDLKSLMDTMREKQQVFLPGEVKCLMQQLLGAIAYLHDNWILHRDIKASNLLLSHNGILKVGDFGLAREYGSPLKAYTSVVVTLWYRAPELLLGIKEYSTHIDVWSVGCIFGELFQMKPLFTGKSDPDQLSLIYKLLGTPSEKIWTGYSKLPVVQKVALPDVPAINLRTKFPHQMVSDLGLALFCKFLTYDPKKRISCEEALKDDYFKESPLPIDPSMFPTWPAKSEMSAKGSNARKAGGSPKPPSGGGAFKKIKEDENDYGFVLNPGKAPAPAPWNLKF